MPSKLTRCGALRSVWVKIKPADQRQVLVHVSTYQGAIWVPIFDPQPYGGDSSRIEAQFDCL